MTGRGAAGARGKTPSSPLSNNSSQNPIRKTYEEYYNEAGQKIKNVETANTLIEKNNLFTSGPDDEIDESYYPAAALFWISARLRAKGESQFADEIRAMAYYIADVPPSQIATDVMVHIEDKLDKFVVTAEQQIRSYAQDQLADIYEARETVEGGARTSLTGEDSETLKLIMERIEILTKQMEEKTSNCGEHCHHSQPTDFSTPTEQRRNFASYAAAATTPQQLTQMQDPRHIKALSQTEQRAREILINGLSITDTEGNSLSEEVLIEKCVQALELMRKENHEVPDSINFICAKKVRNGGVVFELNTAEGARWITATRERVEAFKSALGTDVELKGETYTCMAKFVPVSFVPDEVSLRRVERTNNLPENSIASVRWAKDPSRRHDTQYVANLFISFRSPETANKTIHSGLIINGKKVWATIPFLDVLRCMKCQAPGHMARDCKSQHDICGHCAGHHRTQECEHKNDPSKHRCANCDEEGHPAYARDCPTLEMERDKKNARTPTAGYKYFPTSDPTTWEKTAESQNITRHQDRQAGYNQQLDSGFRQQEEGQWNIVDRRNTNGARPSQSQRRNIQTTLDNNVRPTQQGSQAAPSS